MTIEVEVQRETSNSSVPSDQQFEQWATAALQGHAESELVIRVVDQEESRRLNEQFARKNKATNVLSFPAGLPPSIDLALLGDIVICAPLVESEAKEQNKPAPAHWAHLTIHGVLHLLGYDHQSDEDAAKMERLEADLLQPFGFPDPYRPE
jgi:probable rRNA maturation factor